MDNYQLEHFPDDVIGNLSSSFIIADSEDTGYLFQWIEYLRGESDCCFSNEKNELTEIIRSFTIRLKEALKSDELIDMSYLIGHKEAIEAIDKLVTTQMCRDITHGCTNLVKYCVIPAQLDIETLKVAQTLTHLYYKDNYFYWNLCNPIFNFGRGALYHDFALIQRFSYTKELNCNAEMLKSFIPSKGSDSMCQLIKYCLGYPLKTIPDFFKIRNEIYEKTKQNMEVDKDQIVEDFQDIRANNKTYIDFINGLDNEVKGTFGSSIFDIINNYICDYAIDLPISTLKLLLCPNDSLILIHDDVKTLSNTYHYEDFPVYCFWNVNHPLLNFGLDAMYSCDANLKVRIAFVENELQQIGKSFAPKFKIV